jgi:hypothetical protein
VEKLAESVKKALEIILSTLRARNFTTSVIYCDGEGAIAKLKSQLNQLGIEVVLVALVDMFHELKGAYESSQNESGLTWKASFHLLSIFLDYRYSSSSAYRDLIISIPVRDPGGFHREKRPPDSGLRRKRIFARPLGIQYYTQNRIPLMT